MNAFAEGVQRFLNDRKEAYGQHDRDNVEFDKLMAGYDRTVTKLLVAPKDMRGFTFVVNQFKLDLPASFREEFANSFALYRRYFMSRAGTPDVWHAAELAWKFPGLYATPSKKSFSQLFVFLFTDRRKIPPGKKLSMHDVFLCLSDTCMLAWQVGLAVVDRADAVALLLEEKKYVLPAGFKPVYNCFVDVAQTCGLEVFDPIVHMACCSEASSSLDESRAWVRKYVSERVGQYNAEEKPELGEACAIFGKGFDMAVSTTDKSTKRLSAATYAMCFTCTQVVAEKKLDLSPESYANAFVFAMMCEVGDYKAGALEDARAGTDLVAGGTTVAPALPTAPTPAASAVALPAAAHPAVAADAAASSPPAALAP